MVLQFHDEAIRNFDEKASKLVSLIEQLDIHDQNDEEFASDLYVAWELNESNIIGTPEMMLADYRGKIVMRVFVRDGQKYGLSQENYSRLARLAESICKVPSVSESLSTNYVERTIFEWITKHFDLKAEYSSFMDCLKDKATIDIKDKKIWIPFAFLEIEHSFPIAGSVLQPLSKKLIDEWEEQARITQGKNGDRAKSAIKMVREQYQGLAAVAMQVCAEPERASELALEEAEKVKALLGLVSPAIHIPDIKSLTRPKGREAAETFNWVSDPGSGFFHTSAVALDMPSMQSWQIASGQIETYRRMFFDPVSVLMKEDNLNDFKKRVLGALLIYSKAAYTSDPVEKIIFMLSGLESIILRNESEPIQQNLSERLAFLLGEDIAQRKAIIRSVKNIYGVRSRYLHHGHSKSELEEVSEFMKYVWLSFATLVANVDRYVSKEKFLDSIDDRRLA